MSRIGVEAVEVLEEPDPELRGERGEVEVEDAVVEGEGGLHPLGDVVRLGLARLGEHAVVVGLRA